MIKGVTEIAAMCVGLIGLIGAAATTGLPMWKVTAFIGENIIVMETRWEGLWMNCYRQANIRMQCKVYDSLLYLPPELQAARGLMCCSVALSGLGLLVGVAGLKSVSCFQGNKWAKTIILMVAGSMQFLACICVFIPVSWTGHVIIRDFYNPLLIDAQRRELGEALYIGWVTGAVLFVSAMLFLCRRMPPEKGCLDVYRPIKLLNYKQASSSPGLTSYQPISSIPSLQSTVHQNPPQNNTFVGQEVAMPLQSVPYVLTNNGVPINPSFIYNHGPPENSSLIYQGSSAHQSSGGSFSPGSIYSPGNSLYITQNTTPYSRYPGNAIGFQPSMHPVQQTPMFVPYSKSITSSESHSESSRGVYI